jgi:hypothetical protein
VERPEREQEDMAVESGLEIRVRLMVAVEVVALVEDTADRVGE